MAKSAARKMGPAAPALMPAGAKRQRTFMPQTFRSQAFRPAAAGGASRRERRLGGAAAAEMAGRLSAGADSFITCAKAAAGAFFGSQLYLYYCLCGWSRNNTCRNAARKYLSFTSPLPKNSLAAAAAPAFRRRFWRPGAAKTYLAALACSALFPAGSQAACRRGECSSADAIPAATRRKRQWQPARKICLQRPNQPAAQPVWQSQTKTARRGGGGICCGFIATLSEIQAKSYSINRKVKMSGPLIYVPYRFLLSFRIYLGYIRFRRGKLINIAERHLTRLPAGAKTAAQFARGRPFARGLPPAPKRAAAAIKSVLPQI